MKRLSLTKEKRETEFHFNVCFEEKICEMVPYILCLSID